MTRMLAAGKVGSHCERACNQKAGSAPLTARIADPARHASWRQWTDPMTAVGFAYVIGIVVSWCVFGIGTSRVRELSIDQRDRIWHGSRG